MIKKASLLFLSVLLITNFEISVYAKDNAKKVCTQTQDYKFDNKIMQKRKSNNNIVLKSKNRNQKVTWKVADKVNFGVIEKKRKIILDPRGDYGYIKMIAKIGKNQYSKCFYHGNIIPYTFSVGCGQKRNIISEEFDKGHKLKFKVRDTSVAKIDKNGNVTGRHAGITEVRVKLNGKTSKGTICVSPKKIDYSIWSYYPCYFKLNKISQVKNFVTPKLDYYFRKIGFSYQYVSKQDMYKELGSYDYVGYFDIINRKIAIENNNKSIITILHEFGHFLDYLKGKISTTDEFVYVYNKEKNQFKHNYPKTNSSEYFAECYMYYVLSPFYLKKKQPQSYYFMEKIINSLDNSDMEKLKDRYKYIWY